MERAPAHSVVGKRFSSSGGDKARAGTSVRTVWVWLEGYQALSGGGPRTGSAEDVAGASGRGEPRPGPGMAGASRGEVLGELARGVEAQRDGAADEAEASGDTIAAPPRTSEIPLTRRGPS